MSLPNPYKVGNLNAIKINEEIYKKSTLSYENLLLGRLLLSKGSSPLQQTSLEDHLSSSLKIKEGLKLSSLGLGLYSFRFSSLNEEIKILSKSSCKFPFGVFKFYTWKFYFQPSKIFTISHVWVRFHKLPLEYWHPHILFSVANGIGVPIAIINKSTFDKSFGFYAKVLIEVDLYSPLLPKLLVERDHHFSFVLNFSYENVPKFCGILGHPTLNPVPQFFYQQWACYQAHFAAHFTSQQWVVHPFFQQLL